MADRPPSALSTKCRQVSHRPPVPAAQRRSVSRKGSARLRDTLTVRARHHSPKRFHHLQGPARLIDSPRSTAVKNSDLVTCVATQASLSRQTSNVAVNAVFTPIGDALENGETVTLAGFGTFFTNTRPAREGRNPAPVRPSPSPPRRRLPPSPARPCAMPSQLAHASTQAHHHPTEPAIDFQTPPLD